MSGAALVALVCLSSEPTAEAGYADGCDDLRAEVATDLDRPGADACATDADCTVFRSDMSGRTACGAMTSQTTAGELRVLDAKFTAQRCTQARAICPMVMIVPRCVRRHCGGRG